MLGWDRRGPRRGPPGPHTDPALLATMHRGCRDDERRSCVKRLLICLDLHCLLRLALPPALPPQTASRVATLRLCCGPHRGMWDLGPWDQQFPPRQHYSQPGTRLAQLPHTASRSLSCTEESLAVHDDLALGSPLRAAVPAVLRRDVHGAQRGTLAVLWCTRALHTSALTKPATAADGARRPRNRPPEPTRRGVAVRTPSRQRASRRGPGAHPHAPGSTSRCGPSSASPA